MQHMFPWFRANESGCPRARKRTSGANAPGRRPTWLGVSRQAINAIETGKFDPSLSVAFRLVRLFDLKIEEVFLDDQ
ncbi:helix-turn-helix transcriptional regulator [Actinomadura kijaniata]|uniref:helix-turn-helix transcriptional regulator n=1 Tax=Actinomadura kijaniata TaxID=46161 RepID=UPI003F1BDAB6